MDVTKTPTLSRRKRVVFALVAMALAFGLSVTALLGADIFLHRKFQTSAGVTVWGYRGPTLGRKKPGELRIAFLGGSTAFGYGVTADQAIPAQLEKKLDARVAAGGARVGGGGACGES